MHAALPGGGAQGAHPRADGGERRLGARRAGHPYAGALAWADGLGIVRAPETAVCGADFAALCAAAGLAAPEQRAGYLRREGIVQAAALLGVC